MNVDPADLILNGLFYIGSYLIYRIKLKLIKKDVKQDVKMVFDVVQESGQMEADTILELTKRIDRMDKEIQKLKQNARTKRPSKNDRRDQ